MYRRAKRVIYIFICLFASALIGEERPSHFLSIIMPCYNCSSTVQESIDSIYRQNLRIPFELVCTDDGSTDSTYELLLTIQKHHPNMKVFQHKKNLGGGPARNTCVWQSHGDLIFCLDSDNLLAGTESLQQLIDFLDKEKVDVACFGSHIFFQNTTENEVGRWDFSTPSGRYSATDIITQVKSPPCSGNHLYTRKSFDAVGGYSDKYVLDTFYFGFEQAYHGFLIAYLPGTFYWHRASENGYYSRGLKANLLDREFMSIALHHPDLYTPDTLQYLQRAERSGKFPNNLNYVDVQQQKMISTK